MYANLAHVVVGVIILKEALNAAAKELTKDSSACVGIIQLIECMLQFSQTYTWITGRTICYIIPWSPLEEHRGI